MSMENYDSIGNRICDLPTCSAVLQPAAPPRASNLSIGTPKIFPTGGGWQRGSISLTFVFKIYFMKIVPKSILWKSCQNLFYENRAKIYFMKIVPKSILWKSCQNIFYENRDKISFMKIVPKSILWKSCQNLFYENRAKICEPKSI